MEIVVSPLAIEHIEYWKKTNNQKIHKRIIELKDAILMKSKDKISKEQQKMIDGIKNDYESKRENDKKEMAEELKKIKEAVKGIIYEDN